MLRTAAIALVLAATAIATTAAGSEGWDWGNELTNREWRNDTLAWAQAIHPNHPATTALLGMTPPPREAWCDPDSVVLDSPLSCSTYQSLMDTWLRDYLDVPANETLPTVAAIPPECMSLCAS